MHNGNHVEFASCNLYYVKWGEVTLMLMGYHVMDPYLMIQLSLNADWDALFVFE